MGTVARASTQKRCGEMIASEIPSVIESFIKEENPYHCILIDGAWGIGKSFQIDKALKEIPYLELLQLMKL